MKYKAFGYLWAASTLAMAIGGDAISMEALFLLALCSVVSGIALWYCYVGILMDWSTEHENSDENIMALLSVCGGCRA